MNYSTSCIICGYPITDPICISCHIKQTYILLKDLEVNQIINNFIINKLKNRFSLETLNDEKCILCKKENMTTCYYCFSKYLIKILNELNFTEDLIENFRYNHLFEETYLENETMCL